MIRLPLLASLALLAACAAPPQAPAHMDAHDAVETSRSEEILPVPPIPPARRHADAGLLNGARAAAAPSRALGSSGDHGPADPNGVPAGLGNVPADGATETMRSPR